VAESKSSHTPNPRPTTPASPPVPTRRPGAQAAADDKDAATTDDNEEGDAGSAAGGRQGNNGHDEKVLGPIEGEDRSAAFSSVKAGLIFFI
jgi:hypothetical protein